MFFLRVVFRAAVHKAILLAGVPMEITVYKQLSLLFHTLDHLLGVEDGRVQLFIRVNPLPIKVNLCEVTSIVADDHTVDVEHRYYFEQEVLPQYLSNAGIAQ